MEERERERIWMEEEEMNGTVPKCCRDERKEGEIPEYF